MAARWCGHPSRRVLRTLQDEDCVSWLFALQPDLRPARLTAQAPEPVRGGTLVFGINSGDPPTYDCHQSALFPIIHLLTPHYSNLLKIDTPNYPKLDRRPRRELDGRGRRQDLHLQAPCERQIPRRLGVLRRGRQGDLRPHPQSAAGRRLGAAGPRRRHRHASRRPIRSPSIFRLKRPNRALIYAFANPFNCVYSAAKLKENPLYPGAQRDGHRAVPLRRARRRLALERRALQGLLQAGPALSRRLPRRVHAGRRADQRAAGRPDHGRLPQRDHGRPRPPGRRARRQDHRAGKPLAQRAAGDVQHQEEAVRRCRACAARSRSRSTAGRPPRCCRAPRSCAMSAAICGPAPSSPRARKTSSRCRASRKDIEASRAEAKRLLAEAGVPNLKVRLINRTIVEPVHAGRHLRHRPVAPDRRRDRARAGERDALQQLDERGHVRRRARLPGRLRSTSRPTSSRAISRSTSRRTAASTPTASSTGCSSGRRTTTDPRSATRRCAQFEIAHARRRPTRCRCCGGSASS